MKLTHKAIARMAGYTFKYHYCYTDMGAPVDGRYWTYADDSKKYHFFKDEQEAYVDCCTRCGLIVADATEPDWKDAYLNMKKFAEDSGLDINTYGLSVQGGPR